MLNKPQPLQNPDFSELITLCQYHLNSIEKNGPNDDSDKEHYIYETALEAVFGQDVWQWINRLPE